MSARPVRPSLFLFVPLLVGLLWPAAPAAAGTEIVGDKLIIQPDDPGGRDRIIVRQTDPGRYMILFRQSPGQTIGAGCTPGSLNWIICEGEPPLRAVVATGAGNDAVTFDVDTQMLVKLGGGRDTLRPGRGPVVVVGGSGNDKLSTGNGDDVLRGGPGKDSLSAGSGRDLLIGGGGAGDNLQGRSGRDTLRARDGKPDFVNGGGGRDKAVVDGSDELRSIEQRR